MIIQVAQNSNKSLIMQNFNLFKRMSTNQKVSMAAFST